MNKRNRKVVQVVCTQCGQEFERAASEHKRSVSLGRSEYCSRSCAAFGLDNCGTRRGLRPSRTEQLDAGNRRDKFTGLRDHIRRVKNRMGEVGDLTLEYLHEVWERQGGRCVYTGVQLHHPTFRKKNPAPRHLTASLDRIDSKLGYAPGNIQFVSMLINWAKNDLSDSEFRDACADLDLKFAGLLGNDSADKSQNNLRSAGVCGDNGA